MFLYLIRHADALPAAQDAERLLSPQGESDIKKVAAFLKTKSIKVDVIFHSGLKRAEQTAGIIANALGVSTIMKKNSLGPQDPVLSICGDMEKENKDILMAGHMPYLSCLVSQLLVGHPTNDLVDFKKGAVVCLERDEDCRWHMRWFVIPQLL